MKPRVYVSGPISRGDLCHNIAQAELAFFTLLKAGFAPFCPHWSCYSTGPFRRDDGVYARATADGGGGASHAEWLGVDLAWVAVADALVRLPGESKGADLEVECARRHGVPVFTSTADLLAAFREDDAHGSG